MFNNLFSKIVPFMR